MATSAGVAHCHLQTAYTGLQKSLQQEWAFVQHVTPGIGMAFHPVEDDLRVTFLPDLFQEDTSQIPRSEITGMTVKQAGIDLHSPNQTVSTNWTASCVITGHFVAALGRTAEFRSRDNALLIRKGRKEIQQRHSEAAETALGEAQADASTKDAQRMGRIQTTGEWLYMIPSTVNGTELVAHEWRDPLFLRYIIDPPDISDHCDGFEASLSICHALDYKKGGLITERHNDLCDGVADLASKYFTPMHMLEDPKMFTYRAVR